MQVIRDRGGPAFDEGEASSSGKQTAAATDDGQPVMKDEEEGGEVGEKKAALESLGPDHPNEV